MRMLIIVIMTAMIGCSYKRITHEQSDVIIKGIDIDQSLEIAEFMAKRVKKEEAKPMSLGYWAIRAQEINSEQAEEIDRVYWDVVDNMQKNKFHIWHYSWAIADIYRLGSPDVQTVLQEAYEDAVRRGIEADRKKFVADTNLHLGFFHGGGWRAAKNFLVVPGNRKFTQSSEKFIENKSR